MKNKKTSIIVNLVPEITKGYLFLGILLLAVMVFLHLIQDDLEYLRTIRIFFAVIMCLLLLVRLLQAKMATFDDNGITFHKWICFKKNGTISYSDIEKITLITAHLNTVGKGNSMYADFITVYLDGDREKITENIENMPKGIRRNIFPILKSKIIVIRDHLTL